MKVGIFDYDLVRKDRNLSYNALKKEYILRIEPMKLFSFYNEQRINCDFLLNISEYENYDVFIIIKNTHETTDKIHPKIWIKENVHCWGNYFDPKMPPFPKEVEICKPDLRIYEELFSEKLKKKLITPKFLNSFLNNSNFIKINCGVDIDLSEIIKKRFFYIYDYHLKGDDKTLGILKEIAEKCNFLRLAQPTSIETFEEYHKIISIKQPTLGFYMFYLTKEYKFVEFMEQVEQCVKDDLILPTIYFGKKRNTFYNEKEVLKEMSELVNRVFYVWSRKGRVRIKYDEGWKRFNHLGYSITEYVNRGMKCNFKDFLFSFNFNFYRVFGENEETENFLKMIDTEKKLLQKGRWHYYEI